MLDKHPRFPEDLTLGVLVLVVYGIFFVSKAGKGRLSFPQALLKSDSSF